MITHAIVCVITAFPEYTKLLNVFNRNLFYYEDIPVRSVWNLASTIWYSRHPQSIRHRNSFFIRHVSGIAFHNVLMPDICRSFQVIEADGFISFLSIACLDIDI